MFSKLERFIVRITFPTGEIKDSEILKNYPNGNELDQIVSTSLKYSRYKECSVDIVKKTYYSIEEETK